VRRAHPHLEGAEGMLNRLALPPRAGPSDPAAADVTRTEEIDGAMQALASQRVDVVIVLQTKLLLSLAGGLQNWHWQNGCLHGHTDGRGDTFSMVRKMPHSFGFHFRRIVFRDWHRAVQRQHHADESMHERPAIFRKPQWQKARIVAETVSRTALRRRLPFRRLVFRLQQRHDVRRWSLSVKPSPCASPSSEASAPDVYSGGLDDFLYLIRNSSFVPHVEHPFAAHRSRLAHLSNANTDRLPLAKRRKKWPHNTVGIGVFHAPYD